MKACECLVFACISRYVNCFFTEYFLMSTGSCQGFPVIKIVIILMPDSLDLSPSSWTSKVGLNSLEIQDPQSVRFFIQTVLCIRALAYQAFA